jgi:hypothetical protein
MYFPRCTKQQTRMRLVIKANKHIKRGSFTFKKKALACKPALSAAKLGRTKRIVYLHNAWRNRTRKRSHVGSLMANHGEYTQFGTFFQRCARQVDFMLIQGVVRTAE